LLAAAKTKKHRPAMPNANQEWGKPLESRGPGAHHPGHQNAFSNIERQDAQANTPTELPQHPGKTWKVAGTHVSPQGSRDQHAELKRTDQVGEQQNQDDCHASSLRFHMKLFTTLSEAAVRLTQIQFLEVNDAIKNDDLWRRVNSWFELDSGGL
jgi:hypothetical protein